MAAFDVVDEAIIDAVPAAVFNAIADEAVGKTHWWLPYLEFQPKGNILGNQVGGVFEIIAHSPRGTVRWTVRIAELAENVARVEGIGGDCLGEGTWKTELVDDRARLRYRWHMRTNRWLLGLLALFINFPEAHHRSMQAGFKAPNECLMQGDGAKLAASA